MLSTPSLYSEQTRRTFVPLKGLRGGNVILRARKRPLKVGPSVISGVSERVFQSHDSVTVSFNGNRFPEQTKETATCSVSGIWNIKVQGLRFLHRIFTAMEGKIEKSNHLII